MNISRNTSLKPYNTFGIDVKAKQFISISTIDELRELIKQNYSGDLFILGGGSNMLLTKDIDATVMHINILGKRILRKTKNSVFVEALAGENWHQFVLWTLENNWGGLENLSLIPGNIGTAPIQNIGAYGVELKDTFVSCDAIDIQTLESRSFTADQCEFGYRNSIFKNKVKGKYIITGVTFKLKRKNHEIRTKYGAIDESLKDSGISQPTIQDVSKAIIKIRQQKLPDPRVLGNSGSFFKNPIINSVELADLLKAYPEVPYYKNSENEAKIPAGWLIDKAGLKGYREGDAGVHKNQALVLINYGNASGMDILLLAEKVQKKIKEQFNILLEPEVNIF